MIKIEVGKVFMNKTIEYIAPIFNAFGNEFVDKFISVYKWAYGVGDNSLDEGDNIQYDKHIFVVFDTVATPTFRHFLDWVKSKPYYETDYAFGDVNRGRTHMIVFKLPEEFHGAIEKFKKGQYSKMFTAEQLALYIHDEKVLKILTKEEGAVQKYVDDLNEEYDTAVEPSELKGEIDAPIDLKNEIFNYKS